MPVPISKPRHHASAPNTAGRGRGFDDDVVGGAEIKDICTQAEVERLLPIYRDETRPMTERLAARNRIVTGNMLLVAGIAPRFLGGGVEQEDLISQGSIALMHAIERYDPSQSAFSTYATWWITCFLRRYMVDHGRLVKIPEHLHWLRRRYQEAKWWLSLSLGRTPTDDEIRAELPPLTDERWQRLKLSLPFTPTPDMGEECNELSPHSREPNPADAAALRDSIATIKDCMRRCTKREREILIRTLAHGETLETVGLALGVTRERVRQIQQVGLAVVRAVALGWYGGSPSEARRIIREQQRYQKTASPDAVGTPIAP